MSAHAGHGKSLDRSQYGAALLIALLMLVILLLIGMSAMRIGLLTEKMSRNQRDRQIARAAAEAALSDAEYDVGNPASPRYARFAALMTQPALQQAISCNAVGPDAGICRAAAKKTFMPIWKTMARRASAGASNATIEYGRFSGRSMQTGAGMLPAMPARYLIELLPPFSFVANGADAGNAGNAGNTVTPADWHRLRISAFGYGPDRHTTVLLQSIYLRHIAIKNTKTAASADTAAIAAVAGRVSWREITAWEMP